MKTKQTKAYSPTLLYIVILSCLLFFKIYSDKGINFIPLLGIVILTFIPFTLMTKRFYLALPTIAIFALIIALGTIPMQLYSVTGSAPNLTTWSYIIGFLSTLLIGNITKHPEWSIRSPWVANILGITLSTTVIIVISSYITDMSDLIAGLIILTSYILFSFSYLLLGRKVMMTTPIPANEDTMNKVFSQLEKTGYTPLVFYKDKDRKDTLVYKNTNNSYRVFISNSPLMTKENKKGKVDHVTMVKGKARTLYPWLLFNLYKSMSLKKNPIVVHEDFVVIVPTKADKPTYKIIEVPIPRSKKSAFVGVVYLPNNLNVSFNKTFNKMSTELWAKNHDLY